MECPLWVDRAVCITASKAVKGPPLAQTQARMLGLELNSAQARSSSRPQQRPLRPPGKARRPLRRAAPAVPEPRLRAGRTAVDQKGDERSQVEKQQRVKAWWRVDAVGNVVMSVYYGTKPIEFETGKTGIAVASKDKLPALIDAPIGAAKAGELDSLMASSGRTVGAPKAKKTA